MSTATSPVPWTPLGREFHRCSPADFGLLTDEGVFRPGDSCELLNGLVVLKWPPWGHTTPEGDQYRWSVEQYQRMAELGALGPDDQVELLEGLLVRKMPINPPRAKSLQRTWKLLLLLLPGGWTLRIQLDVALATSQPQPDVAVARGSDEDYGTRHPTGADLGLLVEVADSSLPFDQGEKAAMYARASVPVYWIVNLIDRQVEVYTRPSGPTAAPAYAQRQVYLPGQSVPVVLDGVSVGSIAVDDLLP